MAPSMRPKTRAATESGRVNKTYLRSPSNSGLLQNEGHGYSCRQHSCNAFGIIGRATLVQMPLGRQFGSNGPKTHPTCLRLAPQPLRQLDDFGPKLHVALTAFAFARDLALALPSGSKLCNC